MILGIDEAGRGPVLGPMVMSGVLIDENDQDYLKSLGIKDSKMLSKIKRETIFDELMKSDKVKYQIEVIEPIDIDTKEERGMNLNDLEAFTIAKIIYGLKPDKVFADCPSINPKSFNEDLLRFLKKIIEEHNDSDFIIPEIICEHKADVNYVVASAASVLAKVKRDEIIESYNKEFNVSVGSGYPSDKYTVEFLKNNISNPKFRKIIRMSWNTSKRLLDNTAQQKLKF